MTCLQLPRGKGKMLSFRPKNLAANFIPKKFGYQPTNIFSSPATHPTSIMEKNKEKIKKQQISYDMGNLTVVKAFLFLI